MTGDCGIVTGDKALFDRAAEELDRHGFVVVPGFLTAEEVDAGRANLERYYPLPDDFFAAAPERYGWLRGGQFSGLVEFPWIDDALNDHATSPRMLALARHLVGAEDVRMIEGRAWAKYGGNVDFDQSLHVDYPNHTLAFPRERTTSSGRGPHRELIAFLYYSDVTVECGPTYVLSWEHTGELLRAGLTSLSGEQHSALYEREEAAVGPAGTLVVYTPATFHRGSRLGPPPAYRWISGVAYRAAGADWIGHQAWPFSGGKPEMHRFITRATPEQRTVLGFPPPGDPYWDDETRAGVAARYPDMNMTPYET